MGLIMRNRKCYTGKVKYRSTPSWETSGDLKYRKIGSIVEISCRVNNKADGALLGTLPVGYRPDDYILLENVISPVTSRAQLDPSTGTIYFQNTTTAVNVRIHATFFV